MDVPVITLADGHTHRCVDGHPWVYRSELGPIQGDPGDGDAVEVRDRRRRLIGRGLYGRRSQIAVRLLTRRAEAIDEAFLRQRLRDAIALRQRLMPGRAALRLVSSEGDRLPGLIVDRWGDRLVVQITTAAMEAHRERWLRLLAEELAPAQIVERADAPVRALEGLELRAGVVHGAADARTAIRVGRATVEIDLLDPHKTGGYLDQQLNHEGIAAWVTPGCRVADVCCHLGGFAIHALLAGASEAVAVDTAEASVRGAGRSAVLSGVQGLRAVQADAFAWLRQAAEAGERFDLVVLDPPSFTRNRAGVAGALRGYRDLHLQALRLLPPGGRLATYSCSHHIARADFIATLAEAAASARRTLRLEAEQGAAPDHPVLLGMPESEYLKGVVATVVE